MRLRVVKALVLRSFRGTLTDKGRVSELVIFPISFLVIWGLFFQSGVIEKEIAGKLLVINLIWSISGTFQTQANLTLMFDLWSREFSTILRQGVKIGEMVLAHLVFSTVLGILNLLLFVFVIFFSFNAKWSEVSLFFELFPLYYTASVGLAAIFGGVVIFLGRSYGFIAWTGLQLLIMISSPFSPVANIPEWLGVAARLSPFTYVFEYVRIKNSNDYWMGLVVAILYLGVGCISATMLYRLRRSKDGLMGV